MLRREASRVQKIMSTVDGVVDPRVDLPATQPTIEIEVDLDRAQAFGVTPGDVRRAEATLLQGIQVGSIFEQQKVFDVIVQGDPGTRGSVEDVRNLLIDRPGGGHVHAGAGRRCPRGRHVRGHPTRCRLPAVGRRGRRQRAQHVGSRGRAREPSRRGRVPAGVPRGGARAEHRRRDRARAASSGFAIAAARRRVPVAPGGVPELAPGRSGRRHPRRCASSAGCWSRADRRCRAVAGLTARAARRARVSRPARACLLVDQPPGAQREPGRAREARSCNAARPSGWLRSLTSHGRLAPSCCRSPSLGSRPGLELLHPMAAGRARVAWSTSTFVSAVRAPGALPAPAPRAGAHAGLGERRGRATQDGRAGCRRRRSACATAAPGPAERRRARWRERRSHERCRRGTGGCRGRSCIAWRVAAVAAVALRVQGGRGGSTAAATSPRRSRRRPGSWGSSR